MEVSRITEANEVARSIAVKHDLDDTMRLTLEQVIQEKLRQFFH